MEHECTHRAVFMDAMPPLLRSICGRGINVGFYSSYRLRKGSQCDPSYSSLHLICVLGGGHPHAMCDAGVGDL